MNRNGLGYVGDNKIRPQRGKSANIVQSSGMLKGAYILKTGCKPRIVCSQNFLKNPLNRP
jgi:hypothetical protein